MKPDELMLLYEYAWWARDRLLDAASGMTDEEFGRDNGFTYPSIRGILVHALEAEMFWDSRFRGAERPELTAESVESVGGLKARWTAEGVEAAWLPRRRDGGVVGRGLHDTAGAAARSSARRCGVLLTHVVNHGTQHRSEAAEALTLVGRSPGSLDFTTYVWER